VLEVRVALRRGEICGAGSGLLRRGLLASLAAGFVVALLPALAHPASRTDPGACGGVLLAATSWLGGGGVDVMSNGADQGTGKQCSKALSMVGSVAAGERWQCVELVNRLYLTRGWIASGWTGDGDQLVATATANLTKQANGSITSVSPGDVVSVRERHNGKVQPHGHVAVIDTSGTVTSGTIQLVNQNGGSKGNALVMSYATLSDGKLSLPGGSGWSYVVVGVVHAPLDTTDGVRDLRPR
jgi:CHAP domain